MSQKLLCPYCLGEVVMPQSNCPYCGKPLTNRNPAGALPFCTPLAGGRYTVGDFVTVDGEGLTYRGVDNSAGLFLTIKEYFPVTLSNGRTRAGSIQPKPGCEVLFKTIRNDFQDLYETLRKITPATGLVTVLDVLEANNTVYAVMENAKGVTLSRYLQLHNKKPLSAKETVVLLEPVMEGVEYLHRHGLIHRGICPENILLPIDGGACLTGYATQGLRTAGGELKPKLYAGYSAPEQYSANQFEGFYTDVYGLAGVLYRMNTGVDPVPVPDREAGEELAAAHTLNGSVPSYFSRVIACAHRLDPQSRMQTVDEFAMALEHRSEADAMLNQEPQKGSTSSIKLLAIFVVLLAILACLAVWIIMNLPTRNAESKSDTESQITEEIDDTLTVPNLVGMEYRKIRENEEYLTHFRFAITETYSDVYEEGVVIQQEPVASTILQGGEKVVIQLTVSKGMEEIDVPSIIGFRRDEAAGLLETAGIAYRCVEMENNGDYAEGCVAFYEPNVKKVTPKTTVTLYIAGPRPEVKEVEPMDNITEENDPDNFSEFTVNQNNN